MEFNKTFYFGLILAIFIVWLILYGGNSYYDQHITEVIRERNWQGVDDYVALNNNSSATLTVPLNLRNRSSYIRQHGKYWILYNYVLSQRYFQGNESITYTTMGEYTFLDVLDNLIVRWQAPMSIALLACGSDFLETLNSIRYLRTCSPNAKLIVDFVTFHLFFEEDHLPEFVPKTQEQILQPFDCNRTAPLHAVQQQVNFTTYRKQQKLLFPINLARNIARLEAHTYFVFPLDIELFPTINFVPEFLHLIDELKWSNQKSVFVVPIFEMRTGYELPQNKTELQSMLKQKIAISFHAEFARVNHKIPNQNEWIEKAEPTHMEIFNITKRTLKFWEPFYVTINKVEPLFDERFTNEGRNDKNIQANLLSSLEYDFVLLDKAFLMHRQGIKVQTKPTKAESVLRWKMYNGAYKSYIKQLEKLYVEIKPEQKNNSNVSDKNNQTHIPRTIKGYLPKTPET